jgi:hypothetical protein
MLTLVEDGVTRAGIVISPAATDTERFAAEEFARYVHLASGAVMPVYMGRPDVRLQPTVYIGSTETWPQVADSALLGKASDEPPAKPDALAHPQGFIIRVPSSDEMLLLGVQPVGALWAVYTLVRDYLAVGFPGIGPSGDEVPIATTIVLPEIERDEAPAFDTRGLVALGGEDDSPHDHDIVSPMLSGRVDWMAKHRLNRLLLHSGNFDADDIERHLVPEARKRGVKLEWAHHNMGYWLPSSVYGSAHPEYYAVRNALRRNDKGAQLCLCTSNPSAVDEVAANMLRFWNERPWVDVLGIWPNDGYGMCECDECAALDMYDEAENREAAYFAGTDEPIPATTIDRNKTNRYIRLINQIAERVVAERPDALVSGQFCVDMLRPSVDQELHPAVRPTVALSWRCMAHVLDDPNCPTNRYFARVIDEWQEAAPGLVTIYEYYTGLEDNCSLPLPIVETIRADWRAFAEREFAGGMVHSSASNHVAYSANYAAYAALAWDPSTDLDVFRSGWYQSAYGSARDAVRLWWQTVEGGLQGVAAGEGRETYEARRPGCYLPNRLSFPSLWDQETMAGLGLALDHARESESLTHGQTHRLNQMRTYHTYCVASAEAYSRELKARGKGGTAADRPGVVDALDRIEAFVEQIADPTILSRNRVLKRINELKGTYEE